MSAILKSVVSRSAPVLRSTLSQRAAYWSGPPRVRIPFWEKACIGSVMLVGICAPAGWVMINVKHYKKSGAE